MAFVIDASIAACRSFQDEDHPTATLALDRIRADEACAPSLWWFELRNTLTTSERRGRFTEGDTATFLRGLARLGVSIDRSPDEAAVMALARQHRLTVYDAAYLELAQREGVPLAALADAARAVQVPLLGAPCKARGTNPRLVDPKQNRPDDEEMQPLNAVIHNSRAVVDLTTEELGQIAGGCMAPEHDYVNALLDQE
ncbi:MAG: PilT protein [Rhodospirillales bacterium]|nr:PilT protein [Rhodospirillales bacterium]